MGLLDSFALLALLLVGLPVAAVLGWLLEKVFRVSWLRPVPFFALLAVVVAGVPVALTVAGVSTQARVLQRDERVFVLHDGSWQSRQALRVRYRPADARRADPTTQTPEHDSVNVGVAIGAAAYDTTAVGALVPITYLPFRPSIAKLSDRTLRDVWRETMAVGGVAIGGTLVAGGLLALAVWRWSPTAAGLIAIRRGTFALLAVVTAFASVRVALTSPAHGPDAPTPAAAVANVAGISTFESCVYCLTDHHLLQPFAVVTLAFTPAGARFPVQTADAVDTGSVRGLAQGGTVAIHYAPGNPRVARIDGGARTFEVRNGRDAVVLAAAFWGAVALVCVVFAAWRARRAARRATTVA